MLLLNRKQGLVGRAEVFRKLILFRVAPLDASEFI